MAHQVAVIGAGISGLVAAVRLNQQGIPVQVLEATPQAGGLIQSHRESGFLTEGGPHTFPSTATELLDLARELQLTPQPTRPLAKKRYLVLNGQLVALPHHPLEAISTPVLSWPGKWRLALEPFSPRTAQPEPSVAEFFTRRLGAEATEHLVDPFISGIYAGDIQQLSLPAVFPKLWQREQASGSLFAGARAARKAARQLGQPRTPMQLLSFEDGLQRLVEALAQALPPGTIRLGFRAKRLNPGEDGLFHLQSEAGETLQADAVILAIPAWVAAGLLGELAPAASEALAQIPYASLAVAHTGFPKAGFPHPLDGFGCLVPRRENIALLGSIWASSLFADRAPADQVLLSNFIGGAHQPEIAQWTEQQILQHVLADLRQIFGLSKTLQPNYHRVLRYQQAIPQYTLGHPARIAAAQGALPPAIQLCGNYLHGIALNECVKSGQQAAQNTLGLF